MGLKQAFWPRYPLRKACWVVAPAAHCFLSSTSREALSLSAGAAAFTHTSQGLGVATVISVGMTMPEPHRP